MKTKKYNVEIVDNVGHRDYLCIDYVHLVNRILNDLTSFVKMVLVSETTSPGYIKIYIKTVKIVDSGYYNAIYVSSSKGSVHLKYVDKSKSSGLTKRILGQDYSLPWLLKDVCPARNLVISQNSLLKFIEDKNGELYFECGHITGHVDDWVKEKLNVFELDDLSFVLASYEGKPFKPWIFHKDNPLLKDVGIRI